MISQTAEYALRAMVDLTYHAGQSRTSQQIAEATRVPAQYLAKILKDLARHNLIQPRRGPGGGFTLHHDPTRLTIYDVLQAVDPLQRITSCPLKLPEHRTKLCPLHRRLDEAMTMVEQAFRETTLSEITAAPARAANKTTLTVSGGLAPASSTRKKSTKRSQRKTSNKTGTGTTNRTP